VLSTQASIISEKRRNPKNILEITENSPFSLIIRQQWSNELESGLLHRRVMTPNLK
jgi:hypothetical protein